MIATLPLRGSRPFTWRRLTSYGLLWGIASAAVESFALPLGDLRGGDVIRYVLPIVAQWCLSGVVLAGALTLFEGRVGSAAIAMVSVAAIGLLQVGPLDIPRSIWDSMPPADSLHVLWGVAFYGGLFVLAHGLHERSERVRGALASAEIARQQTEALLSAEQLKVMQSQVDPAFLLQVMTEVKSRYGRDQAGADRLLDALVGFLRDAMPGVRSGASTLLAEVGLARAYARVLAELQPGRGRWRIDVPAAVPDLPFPPLLMLPIVERLASGAPQGIALELRHADGRCILSLHRAEPSDPGWLGAELNYRLRVGLRATLGNAWSLHLGDGLASPAFLLTLATPSSPLAPTNRPEDTHEHDAELLRTHH